MSTASITFTHPLVGAGKCQKYYRDIVAPYRGEDCLLWPYTLHPTGYGMMSHQRVHRLACEEINGPPPTPKHEAAHNCGNRSCVNPTHIRWATHSENEADKVLHGTVRRGESHQNAKFTEEAVRAVRALAHTETKSALARKFGVTRQAINLVLSGKRWGWLT